MRKNTVIGFIGLLFCLCIQAQGTSTSVNSTVNDVDWARAEKFSSDALEQYIKDPLAELSQCILDSSNGSIINVI